ncbi:bifunctional ADP-dependent NAD(P)H-hydrate dehydratase/NAD(P)H-hydrate epimerase [Kiloniella laminariae]|uniref:bifunctional ADP-dependent NAD(P)H-hydrate dehydratase/NAD(P)H-hydrate epimerase n=1 Tax=Kiloniella laminariae TaxID=454162 RepID=UPI0003755202|nr:bifunctional ADP-dependent NAD(P)H-hydrate dehydratase/NAD(P)H-hydrate epimerase [Kiloniella laminariae]
MSWNKTPLLTVEEMYLADRSTIQDGVSGCALMERAGAAVAEVVQSCHGEGQILVLCGPGNNGGDGFVAARLLRKSGRKVKLFLSIEGEKLKGDARLMARRWSGGIHFSLTEKDFNESSLIIDALFGTGLARPLEKRLLDFSVWAVGKEVVSVDIPSGISGDTGQVIGAGAFAALRTVTFFRKKTGHLLFPGRAHCGEIILADIGIDKSCLDVLEPKVAENSPVLWRQTLPDISFDKHKYHFGHAVIYGGEMSGAARLAALAALRIGAGLVTVTCPQADKLIYALASPSLIIKERERGGALKALLVDKRKNAVLVGPGAGCSEEVVAEIRSAADDPERAIVLDADALTVFSEDPAGLFALCHGKMVLTPHEGEFRKLFPDLKQSRIENIRIAARRADCVVILKGADTLVAAPDGRLVINANAPFWLAKGGTGDVLAGMVCGFLAQGMPAFEAAAAAVWFHGEAAKVAGRGMLAEDLLLGIKEVNAGFF